MTAFFTFVIIIEGHFLSLSANFVSLFILDYDSSNRKPRWLFPYFFFPTGQSLDISLFFPISVRQRSYWVYCVLDWMLDRRIGAGSDVRSDIVIQKRSFGLAFGRDDFYTGVTLRSRQTDLKKKKLRRFSLSYFTSHRYEWNF